MKITKFPRVFINKKAGNRGLLCVVYRNRVETYDFMKSENKQDIDKSNGDNCLYDYEDICGKGWNASHEINLMENNGFHEVHAGQTKEIDKED